jgi:hypothetical protein
MNQVNNAVRESPKDYPVRRLKIRADENDPSTFSVTAYNLRESVFQNLVRQFRYFRWRDYPTIALILQDIKKLTLMIALEHQKAASIFKGFNIALE